jgi:PAS domain S-box-containing protein
MRLVPCRSDPTARDVGLPAGREHMLNRYQSLVEATCAVVWTRCADGSVTVDAPALRMITGQSADEHRGWGWLAAVHPAHREWLAATWQDAVDAVEPEAFTRDYRLRTAEGGYRWFRTRAVPVRAGGRVVEWVGTETDVDDAVRASHRLVVLGGATAAMRTTLQPAAQLAALTEAIVPAFADFRRIYMIDPVPPRSTSAVTGRRGATRTADGVTLPPSRKERFALDDPHPVARCVHSAAPVLVDVATVPAAAWSAGSRHVSWGIGVRAASALAAPVLCGGDVLAVVLMVACGDRPAYTEEDRLLAVELAERASAAVGAALTYERSSQVSVALQAAMLGEPVPHPGVEVVGRYLPAAEELQVGGDWYDSFPLPDGDLAIGVGDVVGHDLSAAVAMGQLRSMLRALAHDRDAAPPEVVARLDGVATRLAVTRLASLIYGRLSTSGSTTHLRWSNAGHPPPLLIEAAGEPRLLRGVDLVLGVRPETERTDYEVDLAPGSLLLLYTDGLVERRNDPDDEGQAALPARARTGGGLTLAEFCDHVLTGAVDVADDIALLAVRPVPR